jgi:hypothetical protein
MKTIITNFRKNIMGTVSFEMKLPKMRISQEFSVYPMSTNDTKIMIQSNTRIGYIHLNSGLIQMTGSYQGGAYFYHLSFDLNDIEIITTEFLETLKNEIRKTGGNNVGGLIKCDNIGALTI